MIYLGFPIESRLDFINVVAISLVAIADLLMHRRTED